MLPVKQNNHSRNTRANSRKNKQLKPSLEIAELQKGNLSKKKNINKNLSARDTSDTGQQLEHTVNAGISKNKKQDAKSTIKKLNLESKPAIKDLAKRLHNYSKQYVPEYFTAILEYTIEKEIKKSISPVADQIQKWRIYISRQRQIQMHVKKQLGKMNNVIMRSRKKLNQEIKQERKRFDKNYLNYHNSELQAPDSERGRKKQKGNGNWEDAIDGRVSQQSQCSSIQNYSCPQISTKQAQLTSNNSSGLILIDEKKQEQILTDQKIHKLWNNRFDKFVYLIDTISQLLGDNQCTNAIFPTCYIFYSIVVSDVRIFNYLDKNYKEQPKPQKLSQTYNCLNGNYTKWNSNSSSKSNSTFSQLGEMETLEYYMIVSILIATKYHQIYPVSLVELIQAVNYSLSYERAIKLQGQILEILNFAEFFNENQNKFLKMFGIVSAWTSVEMNVCQFILETGLSNPKLYAFSPLYKAAVAMGIYEQKFLKTQEKFMVIKNLCPGLTFDLSSMIKREYMNIILYKNKNNFVSQRKKFFIFENEMKTLIKGITTNL